MPSERVAQRLQDILDNIQRIREYTKDLDQSTYLKRPMVMDAVERCLERIAEAARKLGNRFDERFPDVDLPKLRQFGSVLRHDYDAINPLLVWLYVENRLDDLETMAQVLVAEETG